MTTHISESDFLDELGPLGLTMRMRRITDRMVHQARSLYRELNLDIEPNWHAVLLLLEKHPGLGIAEIARRLGIKHPSASVLIDQLEQRGYVRRKADPSDGRRQILQLTGPARKKMKHLKRVWQAGADAIQSVISESGHDLLAAIDGYEQALAVNSFQNRVSDSLDSAGNRR